MELMRHMTVGQYVPGTSLAHRLDPRVKIFLMLTAMTVAFSVERPTSLGALLLVCLLGATAARLTMGYFLGGLRTIGALIMITLVFNLLFVRGGTVWYSLGPLAITSEGGRLAFLMTSRLVLLMLMTSLFTLTTSTIRMTDALERILSPLRIIGVPSAEIAMMMSIALRFIPTLVETAERIMKAQMARGASYLEGNMLMRTRALVPVLVPLFVHSFAAAEELAVAMDARCYRGGSHRTRMVGLQVSPLDLGALLVVGVLLTAVVWADGSWMTTWP